jgi:DUF218 domain
VSRARDRITLEDYSRNTVENAVYSKAIVPKPGERWLLVTSAYHMPRAIAVFRKAGFPVEPVQSIGAHVENALHPFAAVPHRAQLGAVSSGSPRGPLKAVAVARLSMGAKPDEGTQPRISPGSRGGLS